MAANSTDAGSRSGGSATHSPAQHDRGQVKGWALYGSRYGWAWTGSEAEKGTILLDGWQYIRDVEGNSPRERIRSGTAVELPDHEPGLEPIEPPEGRLRPVMN